MIELLPPEKWGELESIFASAWKDTCLPNPDHAAIVVEKKGDEIVGFCILETLVCPGNFYVVPQHRGNGTIRRLVRYVQQQAQRSGRSFVAVADQTRYERLFRSLRMRPIGPAFRKDFF